MMDGGGAIGGGTAAQTAARSQWTATALMLERCQRCLLGKGGGATAAEVMDGFSTQRCNERRDGNCIKITMDGGVRDERRRCNGWWDDIANAVRLRWTVAAFTPKRGRCLLLPFLVFNGTFV
jgi:hypothetical protein